MEYHQLLYFVTVAKEKTVLKASEKLLISQPAITRSIQNLEKELGFPLFTREKKRLILNEDGKAALLEARKVIDAFEHMKQVTDAIQKSRQVISFAGLTPAPLWGLSNLFHKHIPDQKVEYEVISDIEKLMKGLSDHQYQFIILDHPYRMEGYITEKLFQEQLHIAVEHDHPLAKRKQISVDDLKGIVVLLMRNTGYWEELCLTKMHGVEFIFQQEASTYASILKASGLTSFRSELTIPKFRKTENRKYIPISDPAFTLTYYVLYHKSLSHTVSDILHHTDEIDWTHYRESDFAEQKSLRD